MCRWRMLSRRADTLSDLNMTSRNAVQAKGGSEIQGPRLDDRKWR